MAVMIIIPEEIEQKKTGMVRSEEMDGGGGPILRFRPGRAAVTVDDVELDEQRRRVRYDWMDRTRPLHNSAAEMDAESAPTPTTPPKFPFRGGGGFFCFLFLFLFFLTIHRRSIHHGCAKFSAELD